VAPGGNGSQYGEWAFWATAAGGAGNTTVTATFGHREVDIQLDVLALSGNNTATPIANSGTNTGTSTSPTALLSAVPASGDLEISLNGAAGYDGGVGTTPTGWTQEEANQNSGNAYGVASYYTNSNGSTSQAFAFTNSIAWATIAIDVGGA
jgi:hypothetical protein